MRLVPDDNIGTGGVGGAISDLDGNLLAGVLLRFIAGINNTDGTAVATTTTNVQGEWFVTGLVAGNYTCIIIIDGQESFVETVQILGGIESDDANITVPLSVPAPIVFPEESTFSEYGPEEVTWSYHIFNYSALS